MPRLQQPEEVPANRVIRPVKGHVQVSREVCTCLPKNGNILLTALPLEFILTVMPAPRARPQCLAICGSSLFIGTAHAGILQLNIVSLDLVRMYTHNDGPIHSLKVYHGVSICCTHWDHRKTPKHHPKLVVDAMNEFFATTLESVFSRDVGCTALQSPERRVV